MSLTATAARPWALGSNPLGLTELDVASGVVLGNLGRPEWPAAEADPLEVLFDEARLALQRGRCVVAFSGGRDSSAILAAMLHVARRDGFDDPLALTARWPGNEDADESAWQEHVAQELSLRHWEIITPGTDFDLLGPISTDLLRKHGLLWPAPVAAMLPMIDAAGEGILVTGEGGDEVFGTWSLATAWDRLRRGQARLRGLRAVAGAALPGWHRRRRAQSTARPYQTWLTAEAQAVQRSVLAAERVAVAPISWPEYLSEVGAERGLRLSARTLDSVCRSRDSAFVAPFLAPAFLAALARRGGRLGLGDRSSAMRAVFSTLLSDDILTRSSKATFGAAFWGPASRQFAKEWDGGGVDPAWVVPDALRAAWSAQRPVYGAALPLQAAWLACDRG
jgi:Asparagine synthase